MQKGHGDAERLVVEGIDLSRFDAAVAGEDVSEEATRTILRNNFVGPKRFGKMFPGLNPFRPPDEALRNLGPGHEGGQDRGTGVRGLTDSCRLHLLGAVHRPRHNLRPDGRFFPR
jgi:hypothetical protein